MHGRVLRQASSLSLVPAMKLWLERQLGGLADAIRYVLRPDPLGRALPLPRRRPPRTRYQHR